MRHKHRYQWSGAHPRGGGARGLPTGVKLYAFGVALAPPPPNAEFGPRNGALGPRNH